MRQTRPSNFTLQFFDGKNRDLSLPGGWGPEKVRLYERQANARYNRGTRKELAVIREFQVPKPNWFLTAERSARRFVKSVGLTATRGAQVGLVDVRTFEDASRIFFHESPTVTIDAETSLHYGTIMRFDRAEKTLKHGGTAAVAQVLVHELVHYNESYSKHLVQRYNSATQEWGDPFRQGFATTDTHGVQRGGFFAEAGPEFIAGLYGRKRLQPDASVVSITGTPSLELPGHYRDFLPPKELPYVSGPEGYAMELLAWGAEQKGIVSSEGFVKGLISVYSESPEERVQGLRSFAQTLNAIRPGLYPELRELQYGREAWLGGLALVHEAVTD